MATIRKLRDKWQAQVRLKGVKPIARSFAKKADAVSWSLVIESGVVQGTYIDPRASESTTLSQVIDRYIEQLKARKKESGAVESRLKRLRSDLGAFCLSELGVCQLSGYRDRRLLEANPATVIHEMSLLGRVLLMACTEFEIPLPKGVPQVRLPSMPAGRVRRLSLDEEAKLLNACMDVPLLHDFIVLAIETAMRRSELVSMKWDDINWTDAVLNIPVTKAGVPRAIPLSQAAMTLLRRQERSGESVWGFSATVASQRFSKACRAAGVKNLRLHDLRHEGISRFFELGLNQIEVASISGHKTLSMLQRYTHINPAFLVARLAVLQKRSCLSPG